MKGRTAIVFLSLSFIWGSTWLGIKVGLEGFPPFLSAALRFIIASIVLFVYVRCSRLRFPADHHDWFTMVFLGLVQITIPYAGVYWGEQYVTSGLASILGATIPFFTAIVSYVLKTERLTFRSVLGIIVGFVGLTFVFSKGFGSVEFNGHSLLGQLAILAASASYGFAYVVGGRRARSIDPVVNVTTQLATGAIFLSAFAFVFERDFAVTLSIPAVVSLLYLALIGSALAFSLLYWLLKHVSATQAGMISMVNPAVALALGWLFLGETVTWSLLVGAGLILWGIYAVMTDRLLPRFGIRPAN